MRPENRKKIVLTNFRSVKIKFILKLLHVQDTFLSLLLSLNVVYSPTIDCARQSFSIRDNTHKNLSQCTQNQIADIPSEKTLSNVVSLFWTINLHLPL